MGRIPQGTCLLVTPEAQGQMFLPVSGPSRDSVTICAGDSVQRTRLTSMWINLRNARIYYKRGKHGGNVADG